MEYTFNKDNNTLIIDYPVSDSPAEIMGFFAKKEHHVTIIGFAAGRIISKQLEGNDRVKDLFYKVVDQYVGSREKIPFELKNDILHIIQKEFGVGHTRMSLIQLMVQDVTQKVFELQMETLFPGIEKHLSMLHVTLGVDDSHVGIGVSRHTWENELKQKFTVSYPRAHNVCDCDDQHRYH